MADARRILIVSDAWKPQLNGVVRTYEHLEPILTAAGHVVRIIGPHDFPLRIPLPFYPEISLALLTRKILARQLRAFAPDHIHIATEGPLGTTARALCLAQGLDFTTSYHTHFPDYVATRIGRSLPALAPLARRICFAWLRRFHAPAHAILVATPSLEAELTQQGFTAPMRRMTRGVDLSVFHPGEKTLFHDLLRPIALTVGRLACEKNLDAFTRMPWPGTKIVVGDGPLLSSLRRAYPQVHFVGRQTGKALADHYRSADVFVFPSRTDTFGMVLVEALACGLPIAAYDVTGPHDIVTQDFLGCLGEDLSASALIALERGDAAARFSHVKDTYQWQVAARQFLDAFQRPEKTPERR